MPLDYEVPHQMSSARKWSIRLLIVAALMCSFSAIGYLGIRFLIRYGPASSLSWSLEMFPLKRWHDDLVSSLVVGSLEIFIAILLLVIARCLRRYVRWITVPGIIITAVFGILLIAVPFINILAVAIRAWKIYHGEFDDVGLDVIDVLWLLVTGLLLLVITTRLWIVRRDPRLMAQKTFA